MRICLHDDEKIKAINSESLQVLERYKAGMPLEDVAVLLSHESTDTTKKYYIKQDTAKIGNAKQNYNI